MMNMLAIDTETGGFAGTSLLSIALVSQDKYLDLRIKPNDGIYRCEARALEINGINLVEHDKLAITEKEAGSAIYTFLHELSNGGKTKLEIVGKNTYFDLLRIWEVISRNTWENFCSYRVLDLNSLVGLVNYHGANLPNSLEGLAKHFNLTHEAHTSLGDARVTLQIWEELCSKQYLEAVLKKDKVIG